MRVGHPPKFSHPTLHFKGRQRCSHLSIAKQGLKHLDRHGKVSSKDFFVFSEVELLRFVKYDIYYNNMFTIGPLIMHQGAKGVPIGGFVSALMAELWAMWRESFFVFGECKGQTCALMEEELLPQWEKTQLPGKPPTLCLSGKLTLLGPPSKRPRKSFWVAWFDPPRSRT